MSLPSLGSLPLVPRGERVSGCGVVVRMTVSRGVRRAAWLYSGGQAGSCAVAAQEKALPLLVPHFECRLCLSSRNRSKVLLQAILLLTS